MKNYDELIQACADCVSACKSSCSKICTKTGTVSKEERDCAKMWGDCATVCEACIHFAGRGSCHMEHMMKVCSLVCEKCAQECSKHNTPECTKVAKVCKKCCEVCNKCCSECRKCA